MRLRIPASSANLGPGFDCFGIAWQLYNEIDFELKGDGLDIKGCPKAYRNRENLAYRGFRAVLDWAGIPEEPLSIDFVRTDIPVSRGLGSSAALICGGAVAADALYGLGLGRQKLLELSSAVEGHPDNIAPALCGGFTVSAMEGEKVMSAPFPLSGSLRFAALVPDFELSTQLSRSVLPEKLTRADAIFNISRSALLIKALETGDPELLRPALEDKLHQPYRAELIPGFEGLRSLAMELGALGFCISGAGSTLLCISGSEDLSRLMSERMKSSFPSWRLLPLLPDGQGAAILSF